MLTPFLCGCLGLDDVDDDLDLTDTDDLNGDLVEVEGYERTDGTWVDAHVRTVPDEYVTNNLSWWDLVNA